MSRLRDRLAATAHPQTSSPFFDQLPSEIRQKIYQDLWALYDTRWHVHSLGGRLVPVFPCVTPPGEDDARYANFQAARAAAAPAGVVPGAAVWEARLRSPWNAHWRCAEAAAAAVATSTTSTTTTSSSSSSSSSSTTELSRPERRQITPAEHLRLRARLPVPLVACKRMYLESVEELEKVFTVCFTDIIVARDFLFRHSSSARVLRNVDISLRVKPLITELYFPGPDGEPQPHVGGVQVTARNNPWESLGRRLARLPSLRSLHVRLDSEDLRPWHKRVNERRFFEQLRRARARDYVLYLPDLPAAPELQGLPGCYLDDGSRDGVPFRVERGPRPNNWQLHLSRISNALPENWSHTLWNQVRDKVWAA